MYIVVRLKKDLTPPPKKKPQQQPTFRYFYKLYYKT